MHKKMTFIALVMVMIPTALFAKLSIITTTKNLASLSAEIGGAKVSVESLCKGTQDPHFLEAKPSYIFKLSKADLLIDVGAGLEEGWLPLVVRGARNPDLRSGGKARLTGASIINLLEKDEKGLTRADGDIHPEGNPHFMLSPSAAIHFAEKIYLKLADLDPVNKPYYKNNFDVFKSNLEKKIATWKKDFPKNLKVVTYHKTLTYFYNEFGVKNEMVLEPKPGIPPTASHIISVISHMKKEKITKIIVENYFDESVAKRITKEHPASHIHIVPVAVEGNKKVKNLTSLYEYLVEHIGH